MPRWGHSGTWLRMTQRSPCYSRKVFAGNSRAANTTGRRHRFIVPDTDGPVTGGTLFNRQLLRALVELGEDACTVGNEPRDVTLNAPEPTRFWVDSLCIDELLRLCESSPARHRVGLIVHYLPSLLKHAHPTRMTLSSQERSALDAAHCLLVTSNYMAGLVDTLTPSQCPIVVVEPGRVASGRASLQSSAAALRATLIANLLPNKGVLPFLRELSACVQPADDFVLSIVGSKEVAPGYARECEKVCGASEPLGQRVQLLGAASPEQAVEWLSHSRVLISASVSESYGMALAEARTLGIAVLALPGGNIANLVHARAGGEIVSSHAALASSFLQLCRTPAELDRRVILAQLHALAPRTWAQAASDYLRQLI